MEMKRAWHKRFEQAKHDDQEGEVGKNAQPEVKAAIKRWYKLTPVQRNRPLLYWLLGASTPEFKMSKEETQYTDTSPDDNKTCGNCEFAYRKVFSGKVICSQISGEIKLPGWCNQWVKGES